MSEQIDITSMRSLTLGSGCKLVFIKKDNKIIPALMLIGINQQGTEGARLRDEGAKPQVGIIISTQDPTTKHYNVSFKDNQSYQIDQNKDWIDLDPNQDTIVYPRIFINSLKMRTDSDSLVVSYQGYDDNVATTRAMNYIPLTQYEDYSVLTRSIDEQYVITLDPYIVATKGLIGSYSGDIETRQVMVKYALSNADTAIYLDAVQVAKENSIPKVSYEVKPSTLNSKMSTTIYNRLGNIVRINDKDLKFKNVRGYVSEVTLDLDNPDQDVIGIKNYKTKFEDLFSTITAQTEAMKKNSHLMDAISTAFTSTGTLSEEVLQTSLRTVDLDYAFNNGKLTIDEHNGIWGTSDSGVVAFRGGGIFTATEKNTEGAWKWNTGITPEGINADLITSGQLDTNLIRVYSGNNLRFQLNGDGLFAYKSQISLQPTNANEADDRAPLLAENNLDGKQYVVFDQEGLSLVAKKGARVLSSDKRDYYTVLNDETISKMSDLSLKSRLMSLTEIKRVEVSWEGLILRNWLNEPVFYADPDTGNLTMTGTINATRGKIGAWNIDEYKLYSNAGVDENNNYIVGVALNAGNQELTFQDPDYPNDVNKTISVNTGPYAFWAGSPNPAQAGVAIKKSGELIANTGRIGGWSLTRQFLYRDGSVVFAPGGSGKKDEKIKIITQQPVYTKQRATDEAGNPRSDEEGKPIYTTVFDGYKQVVTQVSLFGTVMWVPSKTLKAGQSIAQTLSTANFTLTKDGILTAAQINGCSQQWFKGNTISDVYQSNQDHKVHMVLYLNQPETEEGGKTKYTKQVSFNTADGVKTTGGLTLTANRSGVSASFWAHALYPGTRTTIPNSGCSDAEGPLVYGYNKTDNKVTFTIGGTPVYDVSLS